MLNNLDFLNKFKETSKYESLTFFTSDFEDDVWIFNFKNKKQEKIIDFNIYLKDESLLTDKKNKKTLYTIKTLIMESLSKDNMKTNSENTINMNINGLLHFIGLIIEYDNTESFSKVGFQSIDKDMLMTIINNRLENNELFYVYNGLYKLNTLLKDNSLLKNDYSQKNIDEIDNFIKSNKIDLQKELFPCSFLPIQFSLNKVLRDENKISGHRTEYEGYFRENDSLDKSSVITVIKPLIRASRTLKDMYSINDKEIQLPFKEDLDFILNYNFDAKKIKHFETYPIQTIFNIFEKALDFHYEYGNDIITSYLNFLNKLEDSKISNNNLNLHVNKKTKLEIDQMVKDSITEKLRNIGVVEYLQVNENDSEYFSNLRNHKSLHSLLKVYYGSVQFVVGALMARRQSEINSVEVDCFDEINLQLHFRKSKSYQHSFGIKDYISLPCPEIVIELLKNINKISKRLSSEKTNKIFFLPNQYFPLKEVKCKKKIYENFDNMFDYFEVDLIDGKRPYIRQHQLRRFFAMAFFWSSGFKSIDTLRWFMGHTNAEHVYNYIKENTTGEVLNNVKAQYISENIKDYENLEEIFKNKYKISNYNLIEKEDLSDYINAMLEDDLITVEPEFLENDNGQKFEIIVKVKNNE